MNKEDLIMIFPLAAIAFVIVIICIFMSKYFNEHPCLKYEEQEKCYTVRVCDGGIPIQGFCHTKEEHVCQMERTCVNRK